jgi:hypothetical protein
MRAEGEVGAQITVEAKETQAVDHVYNITVRLSLFRQNPAHVFIEYFSWM